MTPMGLYATVQLVLRLHAVGMWPRRSRISLRFEAARLYCEVLRAGGT